MSVMDLGRGGVFLRRDLYKEDFAELNVGRRILFIWKVKKINLKNISFILQIF